MPPSHDGAEELPSYTLFLLFYVFFLCSSARSCFLARAFIFYIPPAPFYYFFLFLYIPPCYFCFYISPMRFLIFYLLSFISYAIVSVIFRARKRLLMLRLLFPRTAPFVLSSLASFSLFLPKLCFCFLLLLPFLLLAKRLHFFFHFFLAFL